MKLAILTAGYLLPHIEELIANPLFGHEDIEIEIFDYKSFAHISKLYAQICDDYQGFIISGLAAYYALEKGTEKALKPTVALDINLEGIYHSLLDLLNQNRALDLSKVLIDILLPQNPQTTAADFLALAEPGFEKITSEAFWQNRTLEQLTTVEDQVYDLILSKWTAGQVDFVLSRYSTLLPRLKDQKIPCSFVSPTVFQLINTVKDCIRAIDIADMREYMPAVIAVFKQVPEGMDIISQDMDIDILTLQKALLDYNRENVTGYQLQRHLNGFYIYTDLKTVRRITGQFTGCGLSSFLKKRLTFDIIVAYGCSKDIAQAKMNATSALKVSNKQRHVYAVNESGTLIGPLDMEQAPLPTCALTPALEEIAVRSRLSPLTVQKLQTIIVSGGSNEITIAELADKLGVKIRNANRILTNLIQSQDAEFAGTRSSASKGRPTKIYRLLFPDPHKDSAK